MATYEQLKAKAIAAYKAGDDEKAESIASMLKQAKATGAFTNIDGVSHLTATLPQKKERSIGEKIVGAGETALGVLGGGLAGAAGQVVGTAKGIGQTIAAGEFGTQKGTERVQREATQTAGEFAQPFMPRTEAGQEYLGAIGKEAAVFGYVNPMLAETAAIANLAARTLPQVKVMTAPARQAAVSVAQRTAETMKSAKAKVLPQKQAEMSTAVTPEEQAVAEGRISQAQALDVPIDLTKGQATRSFAEQQFERETAKNPELGTPIRERYEQQNEALLHNMDKYIESVGAESLDNIGAGQKVSGILGSMLDKQKAKVRSIYKAAEKSGEMESPVEAGSIVDYLNSTVPETANSGALKVARQKAVSLGIAVEDENGVLIPQQTSLKNIYELRKTISNNSSTPTDFFHGGQLKSAIDEAMESAGGTLIKKGIEERKNMANTFEKVGIIRDITGYKKGTTDRKIAAENIFQKSILSNDVESVGKLKSTLLSSGNDGVQAWKELEAATLRHIKDNATANVARDSKGNQVVSASGLDKAVSSLDKNGKLDLILGKDRAKQIRTINDVAKDVLVTVPNAVNNSNTAAVLSTMFDMIVSASGGIPAPVATSIRMIMSKVKSDKIKARVDKNLNYLQNMDKNADKKNKF